MWPVDGVLRRCFICIKFTGYQAQTWPHSQTLPFPYRTTMLCSSTFYSLRLKSSFNTWYFSQLYCGHPPLFLFLSSSLSLSFGGKGLWKEIKYLGWNFDGAGNRTLDHWPPHPRPKDETTQQDPGLPTELLPRTGLLADFAFQNTEHYCTEGDFPFFLPPSPLPLTARRASLDWV